MLCFFYVSRFSLLSKILFFKCYIVTLICSNFFLLVSVTAQHSIAGTADIVSHKPAADLDSRGNVGHCSYIPKYVEVLGSSWNHNIHGVYKHYKDSNVATVYPEISNAPPVYLRLSLPPMYIFKDPVTLEKWIISPNFPPSGGPIETTMEAELKSLSCIPCNSKGWYVRSDSDLPIQLPVIQLMSDIAVGTRREQMEMSSFNYLNNYKNSFTGKHISSGILSPSSNQNNIPSKYIQETARSISKKGLRKLSFLSIDSNSVIEHSNNDFLENDKHSKAVLTIRYDNDVEVHEALPDTFSTALGDIIQSGCPDKYGMGMEGIIGYKVHKCEPPDKNNDGLFPELDFQLNGVDHYLTRTLFSWDGYFLKRPYFALRSSINTSPFGVVVPNPKIRYMWAKGSANQTPTWYISRELGNTDPFQLFSLWYRDLNNILSSIPANWPAQRGIELSPNNWILLQRLISYAHLKDSNTGFLLNRLHSHIEEYVLEIKEQPTVIYILRCKLTHPLTLSIKGPVVRLNGLYEMKGMYKGYPFFRHIESQYVLFRGRVIAADKDTWVIGCKLGSIHGLLAFTQAPNARAPHYSKSRWYIWTHNNEWERTEHMEVIRHYNYYYQAHH